MWCCVPERARVLDAPLAITPNVADREVRGPRPLSVPEGILYTMVQSDQNRSRPGLGCREVVVWGVKLAGSTLGWYVMSVGLTLFNKWILGCTPELILADPDHGCDQYWVVSFKFPVR